MRIQVIPAELRALAGQWRQAAHSLEEVHLLLQRAWNALDWEVRQSGALEAQVVSARRQVLALIEEAARLARFLEERAAAFEQADQEGTVSLGQVFTAWRASAPATSIPSPVFTFPTARTQRYLDLGSLVGLKGTAPRLNLLRIEPDEKRALVDWTVDEALGLLGDLWDATQVPAWQERVDHALQAWANARRQFGTGSPQAQDAYGRYLEELVFKMPFFGPPARALLAVLKIVGRMHPVE